MRGKDILCLAKWYFISQEQYYFFGGYLLQLEHTTTFYLFLSISQTQSLWTFPPCKTKFICTSKGKRVRNFIRASDPWQKVSSTQYSTSI